MPSKLASKEIDWANSLSIDDPFELAIALTGRIGVLADAQSKAQVQGECGDCTACCMKNYPIIPLMEAYAIAGWILKLQNSKEIIAELEDELSVSFTLNTHLGMPSDAPERCFFLRVNGCMIHAVRPFPCTAYGLFRPTDSYCKLSEGGTTGVVSGPAVDVIYESYSRFCEIFMQKTGMPIPYARVASVFVYDIIRNVLDPNSNDADLMNKGLSLANFYPWAYTGLPSRYFIYDPRLIDKQRLWMLGDEKKIVDIELEEMAEGKYFGGFRQLNNEIKGAVEQIKGRSDGERK